MGSFASALILLFVIASIGCGVPKQPPGPPPAIVSTHEPAATTPVPSATHNAAAATATATPDLKPPRPIQLAAEEGVPLGSPPSALLGYCNERGGKVARSVTSNRGFVHCHDLPPPMIEALAWYCGDALMEDARLCRIVHTSEPISTSEAAKSLAFWTDTLAARFGPATQQTETDARWATDEQRISTFSDRDKRTSQHTTSVVYESFEARGELSGQPEFPTAVAGFELGLTRQEAKLICKRQRGMFVDIRNASARGFICASLKVESSLAFTQVGGLYCDGRLCELSFDVSDSSRRALLLMSDKYGDTQPQAVDDPKCEADAKRYTWRWSRDDELVGLVRLVDDCSPVVYYDNAAGWNLRTGQQEGGPNGGPHPESRSQKPVGARGFEPPTP